MIWGLIPYRNRRISVPPNMQTGSGAYPGCKPDGVLGSLSRGVKHPEREVDSSPPSGAVVKNEWGCAACLPVWC